MELPARHDLTVALERNALTRKLQAGDQLGGGERGIEPAAFTVDGEGDHCGGAGRLSRTILSGCGLRRAESSGVLSGCHAALLYRVARDHGTLRSRLQFGAFGAAALIRQRAAR